MNSRIWSITVLACLLLVALGGCAGRQAFMAGGKLMEQGQYDAAVAKYLDALEQDPQRVEYQLQLLKAKGDAALFHLAQGRRMRAGGNTGGALDEFRIAVELDPDLKVAAQEIADAEKVLEAEDLVKEAEDLYRLRRFPQARQLLEKALRLAPGHVAAQEALDRLARGATIIDGFELDVTSDKPITLSFKDADIRDVFGILSKLSGINFIFDEDLGSEKITVFLEEATFAQSLELLLQMNKLGKKVLNPKTIIIYGKTKDKEKQYKDQLIQTFYLSNIDAKKAVNLLRTMLQLRKVYVHEELNALVMRDEPEVVKLAQQILEAADRGDAEVVFALELLEVNHNNDLDIGPKLSTYSASLGFANSNIIEDTQGGNSSTITDTFIVPHALSPGSRTSNLVGGLGGLQTFYTIPSVTFNLLKTRSDAELLSNPKIRVKNKEKAKVHIGSREPIITVTINGDQTSENVQYVDVGVKLEVEPTIQLDDSIVTKLNLEVSNVANREKSSETGTTVLTISTTNAQTALTLKDGEQTIIGGLLRDDVSKSKQTIPLLGDLPLIGSLFTSHSNTKVKREILLSITPHVVRSRDIPTAEVSSIWSGGEDDLKAGSQFGSFAASFEPELDSTRVLPVPARASGPPAGIKPTPASAAESDEGEEAAPVKEAPAVVPEAQAPAAEGAIVPVAVPVTAAPPAQPVAAPSAAPQVAAAPPAAPQRMAEVAVPERQVAAAPRKGRVYLAGTAVAKTGDEIVLTAQVDEVAQLYSAPLFVTYDARRLEFLRAEEGDFLGRDGQATIFTSSANPAKGQLIVGHKQGLGGAGVTGSGTLFRLVFRTLAPGTAPVGLEKVNFRNPAGARLPLSRDGLTVEIR